MRQLSPAELNRYTNPSLAEAHMQRMMTILQADIDALLPGNPYLFLATAPVLAGDIVAQALNTHIQVAEGEFVDALLRHLVFSIGTRGDTGTQNHSRGGLESSDHSLLYASIAETVRREVKACRDTVAEQEARANNRMLKQFLTRYCDERGACNRDSFIARNRCSFDLTVFLLKS